MKKRLFSLLLFLVIWIALPSEGFADNNTILYLTDLGMTIGIPDDYYVLTRDISSSDPALSFLGFTKADCINYLESSNFFLDAVDPNVTTEIVVRMTDNDLPDMNLLPDATIDVLISSISDVYSNNGLSVTSMDYYQHKQAKFIELNINQESDNGNIYGIQYYTIYDYKAISVTLHSYDGHVSDQDKRQARTIIDSIVFDFSPVTPEPAKKTDSFLYTDTETKTNFTVPANWEQGELTKPRNTIDVKFESTDGEAFVLYGSTDFWSQLTASERAGTSRAKFNLSALSHDELKEIASDLGSPYGAYKRETIGGIEYCRLETSYADEPFSIPITVYLTISDGYIYLFQFSGGNAKAHYDDFVQLLNSVSYKANNASSSSSGGNTMIVVLTVFVLILVIACTIIAKSKKRSTPVALSNKNNSAPTHDSDRDSYEISKVVPAREQPTSVDSQCPACGREVSRESKFCPFCGTKLNPKE